MKKIIFLLLLSALPLAGLCADDFDDDFWGEEETPAPAAPILESSADIGFQFLLGGYMKDFGDLLLTPDPDSYMGVDIGISARFYPVEFLGVEAGYAIFGIIYGSKDGYDDYYIYETSSLFGGASLRLMLDRGSSIALGGGVTYNFLAWGSSTGGTSKFDPNLGWYGKAQVSGYLLDMLFMSLGAQVLYFNATNQTGPVFDGVILKIILSIGLYL